MGKKLALFDFDGTISSKDSFLYFLRYTHPVPQAIFNLLRVFPQLVAYKLGVITNEAAKQKLFAAFYKGVTTEQFDAWAKGFLPQMNAFIKPKALNQIREHQQQGDRVIVVSAGFDRILKYWCEQEGVELLATCIETKNGVVTGSFNGRNCYGPEKVNRVKALLALSDYEDIYAYGDSRGDLEMIGISTRPLHLKGIFE